MGTIGNNAIYYPQGDVEMREETWWQQVIDAMDMKLCVNNSWSGSAVYPTRYGVSGAYVDRCVQLHNDHTGEEPDVIVVFMGTNDFSYHQSTLGSADIDYSALIVQNQDGSYTYSNPKTSCEAYAIMLHKMVIRYPDAEIFCMSLLPRREKDYSGDGVKDPGVQPTVFNGELAKIINYMGCTMVDLEHCGIVPEVSNFDYYMWDKRVHPGELGMDLITNALIGAMVGKFEFLYNVLVNCTGVTCNNDVSTVAMGEPYHAKLSSKSDSEAFAVVVTMAGKDITSLCYKNGEIYIAEVIGDIVIQAWSEKE